MHPPGSWQFRPEAATGLPNLVLAADYVRTHTDLATMEGANEAARRAVNAILDRSESTQPRCSIWPLREPAVFDRAKQLQVTRSIGFRAPGLRWIRSPALSNACSLAASQQRERATAVTQSSRDRHVAFTRATGSMCPMMTSLLCLLVFLSATLIDYGHARCVVAINEGAAHRAACWSIVQWAGATIGFIIAVKVTFWVLPFEGAGLYLGTLLAISRKSSAKSRATHAQPLSQRFRIEPVLAALSCELTRSSCG